MRLPAILSNQRRWSPDATAQPTAALQIGVIEARIWVALALALALFSLAPIWMAAFPPLQDYPYHLLRIHILSHYTDPTFNYSDLYTVSFFPIPYILFDYLMSGLSALMPVQVAGKVLLSLYVVLLPLSVFFLLYSVDKSKLLLGFFSYLFIYNWHVSMGFMSFALSLPCFFFAVGAWWQWKGRPTWQNQVVLALLILCVYLAHLITFFVLLYTLAFLALVSLRNVRKILLSALPVLPSLGLLAVVLVTQLSQHVGGGSPLVLEYLSLSGSLRAAIGRDLFYFTAFSPSWERAILFAAAGVAALLLLLNVRSLLRNAFFWLFLALSVLYLLLPSHIAVYFGSFSCRVLIFIALVGLLSLAMPRMSLLRAPVIGVVVLLAGLHLYGTLRDYQAANRWLQPYYTAMEQIPPGAKVLFRTDRSLSRYGRIEPLAFFRGYHYLKDLAPGTPAPVLGQASMNSRFMLLGGGTVPPLGSFMGTLRTLQYKQETEPTVDALSVVADTMESQSVGQYVVLVLRGDQAQVAPLADQYGYTSLAAFGNVQIYRRDRTGAGTAPGSASGAPAHELPQFRVENYDYLLLYQDEASLEPAIAQNFEQLFTEGNVHVFKRRGG